jgi:hypothetical protein
MTKLSIWTLFVLSIVPSLGFSQDKPVNDVPFTMAITVTEYPFDKGIGEYDIGHGFTLRVKARTAGQDPRPLDFVSLSSADAKLDACIKRHVNKFGHQLEQWAENGKFPLDDVGAYITRELGHEPPYIIDLYVDDLRPLEARQDAKNYVKNWGPGSARMRWHGHDAGSFGNDMSSDGDFSDEYGCRIPDLDTLQCSYHHPANWSFKRLPFPYRAIYNKADYLEGVEFEKLNKKHAPDQDFQELMDANQQLYDKLLKQAINDGALTETQAKVDLPKKSPPEPQCY